MNLDGKWQALIVAGLVLLLVAVCGLMTIGNAVMERRALAKAPPPVQAEPSPEPEPEPSHAPPPATYYSTMTTSKLPGPSRSYAAPVFVLNDGNSQTMIGYDDLQNERWCDIAGNFYNSDVISNLRYEKPGSNGPIVRVRIKSQAPTLTGRLEARGLKPNFAYQIKLRGVFSDRAAFERIGAIGRWRLPGRGTNYTDDDYQWYPFKQNIEAYVLFDFFVTDRNGDAVRDFALDSSLHVLFNGTREGTSGARADDLLPVVVDAGNTNLYARPKQRKSVELLWAQREPIRYHSADQIIRLPAGDYHAELVLTEESFHSIYNDGGYWATVYQVPIQFTVTPERGASDANPPE